MLKLRKILLYDQLYYLLSILAITYFLLITNLISLKTKFLPNETEFTGKIIAYKIDGNVLNIDLKAKEKLKMTYYISTEKEKEELISNLKLGITIKVFGILEEPLNNTIPNTFNYKKYLYNKRIFWSLKAEKIEIISADTTFYYRIKNFIKKRIISLPKSKEYINAFILGDISLLNQNAYQNYQQNGVSHLFALSGSNVSLFSGLIIIILRKLKISENKSYLAAIGFIVFYAFLANLGASILRAGLFFSLLTINKIFYTNIKSLNILLLTGVLLILANPFIMYDIGFQYSFATSFGLLITANKLNSKNYIINLVLVSWVAFLFSIPITLSNFYEINLLSVINNLFFVPIVTFILYPLSLFGFIFPFLDNLIYFFIWITEIINTLSAKITVFSIIISKLPLFLSLIYYLLLILLIFYQKIIFKILIVLILLFNKYKYFLDSNAYVYFLDVGQGDSTIIRAPFNQEVIMIDTGGKLEFIREEWTKQNKTYHLSDNTLTFLKSIGVTKIDNLILTHGDEDHLGETINILNNFKVKNIIFNHGPTNKNEQEIINNFSNKNILFDFINSKINISSLNNVIYNDENNDSQVLLFNIYNYKLLFMGDASKKVEEKLLQNQLTSVDLVKLGHHGSKTSSSPKFIEQINPDIAIVSAGRKNRFKHPSTETIETLKYFGIDYYNTQTDGTICLKISSTAHNFFTYQP